METTFVVRREELDEAFLEAVKRLFRNSRELQITISTSTDFSLNEPETKEQYFARLEKAAHNLETGQSQVKLTPEQFDDFSLNLLK